MVPRLRSAGLGLLLWLVSDFHSCLHPFPLSPGCRWPLLPLPACFLLRASLWVWGAGFFITMCLNKGQRYSGPGRPNYIIFLRFRIQYESTLYFLICHLAHSRPPAWACPSYSSQCPCCQPLWPWEQMLQAGVFPRAVPEGKCWLNEWLGIELAS